MLVPGALAVFCISSSAYALTFTVDSTLDAPDATPGDGVCATADNGCSLRAAVMEANASAGADLIDLSLMNDPAAPIVLSIEGVDEVIGDPPEGSEAPCGADITANAAIGDLDITEDIEIIGAGPALTIIEWENQSIADPDVGDRIFHVQADTGVTINLVRFADLMLRNGSVGIPNTVDVDNVYNCTVEGDPGSIIAWQFKRVGGAVATGPGAMVFLFEEAVHGPGGDEGGGGPPENPGEDEGEEGGISAVEFERVAFIGNQAGSDGGALLVAAETTVIDSVFSGNLSAGNGGAMYIDSATTIHGSLLGRSAFDVPFASGALSADFLTTPNSAENGGGIFDTGSHTTNIGASAIVGNTAIGGGGIAARSLVVINLTNSTVSGNVGSDVGGGITTNGTVNLRNATIADNVATTDAPGGGAGLNAFGSGTYTFFNTILSNNVVAGGEVERYANCGCSGGESLCPTGRMISTGYNINDEETESCSLTVVLNDMLSTDPLLLPLADNGGLTPTHALASTLLGDPATSPAIDSADNGRCPNNDQRGSLRPDDGDGNGSFNCDIGAFELFIARADLHINNVTAPNRAHKNNPFETLVEIHNDNANVAVPGVTYTTSIDAQHDLHVMDVLPSQGTCTVAAQAVDCELGDMAIGAIATVDMRLVGGTQGHYAFVSEIGLPDGAVDLTPGNNVVQTSVQIVGDADLVVTGEEVPASIDQGDVLTLGYTVTNNGTDQATTARLGMTMPSDTVFVSGTSTVGDCAAGAGEILCTIGELDASASAVIEIQLQIDAAGAFEFTVNVAADQLDPDASNNSVSAAVTAIANADLGLSGSGPASVTVNNNFNVTMTVSNSGPQDATNVLATVQLPASVSFVSSADCTLNAGALECAAVSLASGESVSFTVTVSADTAGAATVTASVVADENDPTADNNTGSVSVSINSPRSSGGCVYNPDSPSDPTLPLLLLLASLALLMRRRLG